MDVRISLIYGIMNQWHQGLGERLDELRRWELFCVL